MKKSLKLLSAVLILALFIGSAVECCKSRSRLCCHKYETGSDLTTYCNNHRNAVVKYIESAEGEAEKKVRFDNFKQFYNTAKSCTTVECIETQIAENTSIDGFQKCYNKEHEFSEQETDIDPNVKVEVILCGFKHAIDVFGQLLSD